MVTSDDRGLPPTICKGLVQTICRKISTFGGGGESLMSEWR